MVPSCDSVWRRFGDARSSSKVVRKAFPVGDISSLSIGHSEPALTRYRDGASDYLDVVTA